VSALTTSVAFTLPRGYLDATGTLHKDGEMRLATAGDEILPLRDPRVEANPAYLTVILLSRVVTRLGTLDAVTPQVIEGLFTADLVRLQDLYNELNSVGPARRQAACPHCGRQYDPGQDGPGKWS
jgi:hypothetical protein